MGHANKYNENNSNRPVFSTGPSQGGAMAKEKTPKHYRRLQDQYPQLMNAVSQLGEAVRPGPLDEKTAQLVQLAAAAANRSEGAVHSHARRALGAGATPAEGAPRPGPAHQHPGLSGGERRPQLGRGRAGGLIPLTQNGVAPGSAVAPGGGSGARPFCRGRGFGREELAYLDQHASRISFTLGLAARLLPGWAPAPGAGRGAPAFSPLACAIYCPQGGS